MAFRTGPAAAALRRSDIPSSTNHTDGASVQSGSAAGPGNCPPTIFAQEAGTPNCAAMDRYKASWLLVRTKLWVGYRTL